MRTVPNFATFPVHALLDFDPHAAPARGAIPERMT
jgi:hypothetical protein